MILLIGGTSDTAPLAERLARAGLQVLVSTATDERLCVGDHGNITRRSGPLGCRRLRELIERESIRAVVDATHPYATEIRRNAQAVSGQLGVPYLTYVRPSAVDENEEGVCFASDHEEAAKKAFALGRGVLITTGSNNLDQYVAEARRTGLPLCARVLPREESLEQCTRAGIAPQHVIARRAPFGIEDNRKHIRQLGAGVLVTKDGGEASGVRDKLQAARLEGCSVVVIRRPGIEEENAFDNLEQLAEHVIGMFPEHTCGL
ncbi:MAG: precorrin-6A reductase [Thermoguttaceae bacterium]